MRIIDPGHEYALSHLDGEGEERLVFVKREGAGYPGNVGHHAGTNIQEVLRALIDRIEYLHCQIPCLGNRLIQQKLRESIELLEERAANIHKREPSHLLGDGSGNVSPEIEKAETCGSCGHIGCIGDCHALYSSI